MQQRLQLLTLGVGDLDASKRFYLRWFDAAPLLELDDVVFLRAGHGLAISLFPADKLAADFGNPDAANDGVGRVTFGHNVGSEDEVDRVLAAAAAAGGTIVKPAQRAFWGGYHGYVTDPDGFLWEIAHNPGLVFADDGSVAFTEAGEPGSTN